jgi:protein-tyrosine phosphatase
MGNICRSPTAHGVMRELVEQNGLDIRIDSAGTHAYHVNEAPDPRACSAAAARGIDISDLRARAVELEDFNRFDYILAMDHDNLALLERMCPHGATAKISLMLSYAETVERAEVPDPYFGGPDGFEHVLDMLENASRGLLESLQSS